MNNGKSNDKPLDFYLNKHYPTTFYPDDDGGFTVVIKDLPGCMTQGDTFEEAFEMIAEAKALWLESAYEDGVHILLPSTENVYSGKTMVRMPIYLHEKLAKNAKREGCSLNQYIVSLLSERDALREIQDQLSAISERVQQKARSPYVANEASASEDITQKQAEPIQS